MFSSGVHGKEVVLIRPLQFADVHNVARIHLLSFPGFFLSSLGLGFLRQYYLCIVKFSQYGFVAVRNSKVIGFIVGVDGCSGFYKKMLKFRALHFATASIPALIKKPSLVPRLLGAFWKKVPVEQDEVPTVHLTSIGVLPELSGGGIGHLLITEFNALISQSGFSRVVLETDAENNERVCQFYRKEAFKVRRTFFTPHGRKMIEFEKEI